MNHSKNFRAPPRIVVLKICNTEQQLQVYNALARHRAERNILCSTAHRAIGAYGGVVAYSAGVPSKSS